MSYAILLILPPDARIKSQIRENGPVHHVLYKERIRSLCHIDIDINHVCHRTSKGEQGQVPCDFIVLPD